MGTLARCWSKERCAHGPGLWLLENPTASLWGSAPTRFRHLKAQDLDALPPGRILLFIHGMEYGCAHEVIRDFVRPFERGAGVFENGQREDVHCLFLHWDSRIFGGRGTKVLPTVLQNIWRPAYLKRLISEAVTEVEWKASLAADRFAPMMEKLVGDTSRPAPLVITHSMGAYLWSELVQSLLVAGKPLVNLGNWWSMQPAIPWTAFASDGEFEAVGALYSNESFRKTIWYSHFDIVLATLYLVGKGRFAMGQLGARFLPVEQVNLAFSAREAHGATCVGKRNHTFFSRVKKLIRGKASELALLKGTVTA